MHQACANSKVPPFFALESTSELLLDNSHTNGSAYSINSVLPKPSKIETSMRAGVSSAAARNIAAAI
jgi:hypothetical protein